MSVGKPRKINMQLFIDYRARWSKEPQWENDCGSLSHSFLLVRGLVKSYRRDAGEKPPREVGKKVRVRAYKPK